MLRPPAVAGTFYPGEPQALSSQVRQCVPAGTEPARFWAGLVPHAGYVYSGRVAGAVYSRIALPRRIIILGVRHFPYGEEAAMLTEGAWRTPLGDAQIDSELAVRIARSCPLLVDDPVAHEREHSLEVQIPFLQVLDPGFTFVPIALGALGFAALESVGQSLGGILSAEPDLLLLTTTDFNHYEDQETTRHKDQLAIERILEFDARGLFEVCRKQKISMCGLGPTVTMLTALQQLGASHAELVEYRTSADYSGDTKRVVGYGGFLFS